MSRHHPLLSFLVAIALSSTACATSEELPAANEFGTNPKLVQPVPGLLPTLKPAKAVGWPDGMTPVAAEGLTVNAFAKDLDHPRWLLPLANGDVLVAESQSPKDSGGFSGIKGWFADKMMSYAGSGGNSANRIMLLRDTNDDGTADVRLTLVTGLNSPIGMVQTNGYLYVANTDALVRFPFTPGQTEINSSGETVAALPAGSLNHHWTKNIVASPDGRKLYVSVGSNSNIAENGMEAEENRAAILEIDTETGGVRVFASGLRNPVGMDWNPVSGELWAAVNERDELGDQLVPDYITSVQNNAFYGWPWSYWGQHVDERVQPQKPEKVAAAIAPDYALGAHTASLGLTFYRHDRMPQFKNGAIVGQHGSWNRNPRSGYKVIFVHFENGDPLGMPQDLLTGFLSEDGEAYGRPAGVAVDTTGAILVADDVGNTIWRISNP